MSVVTLVSGGLDSTVMAAIAQESGLTQHPLFIDYGQRFKARELAACRRAMRASQLPEPRVAGVSGFGKLIRSGLTDATLDVVRDAFTPGRNMLFLLVGASYAYTLGASAVAIGLLNESTSLFPDQTSKFRESAQRTLTICMGREVEVLAPLGRFYKKDIVELARQKGISSTYSCHAGGKEPCGKCISCMEFNL